MATRLEKTQSVDSVLPNLVRFLKSLGTNKNAAPRSSSHNDAYKRYRIECNDIDCAIMDAAIFFLDYLTNMLMASRAEGGLPNLPLKRIRS